MRHRQTWFTRWTMKRRAAAEAAGRAEQEAEQRRARRRVLDQATAKLPVVVPRPARPDRPLQGPELPLLTRGQAARSPRPAR